MAQITDAQRKADPQNIGQFLVNSGGAGMWELAATQLRKRIERDPENRAWLEALAQIYRQQGELAPAAALYEKLTALDPADALSRHLHAVLSQSPLPFDKPAARPWAVPFVRIRDFLSCDERDHLLSLALKQHEELRPLDVYDQVQQKNVYRPEHRRQVGAQAGEELQSIVRSKFESVLPTILPRLQMELLPFEVRRIRITLAQNDHFATTHTDDHGEPWKAAALYYLQPQPKRFRGGDLLLFDTDVERREFCPAQFTRIPHEDNTLIAFPSNYFHQVTKVECESDRFEEGRLAISTFVERLTK